MTSPSQPTSPSVDGEALLIGLDAVSKQIRSWLEWDRKHRAEESLTTHDGTHIMSLPVPFWPSHGTFENWIKIFDSARDALSRSEGPMMDPTCQFPSPSRGTTDA